MTIMRNTLTLATLALGLVGCAQRTPPMYGWGNYQQQVYVHFKGETSNPDEQAKAMEDSLQQIQARNEKIPPGFHAHLGMLYASLGKDGDTVREFESEKALFPESGPFMNFLMRKYKNQEVK